ncbi:MAG: DNA-binding response regulator [Chloroflexota bacterium]|nr:MAG: DNA-binding response regulator [Chloroflexota bacterium]
MSALRLIIVDDHEVVRLGLMTLFEDIEWIEVLAEVGTAKETFHAVDLYHPDIVILDINLPGESGIEICQQITENYPETKVIMLTSYLDDELIIRALQAGASGYVLKQVDRNTIIDALEAVRQGNSLLDPIVTQRIIARVRTNEKAIQMRAFDDLTNRELDVLFWVAKGKSNEEIAGLLSITSKTIGHHVSNILHKLGVRNRVEAAIYASTHNIENMRNDKTE